MPGYSGAYISGLSGGLRDLVQSIFPEWPLVLSDLWSDYFQLLSLALYLISVIYSVTFMPT